MPEKKARFALRSFAATVLVSLCAAAPAAATTVTISGSTDVRTCWIATDGVIDIGDCGQSLIGDITGLEFRGLLHFDVAAHVPPGATVSAATVRLPLNGWLEEEICDAGFNLRAQGGDGNWLDQTPTWSSPDGGTTSWNGSSDTWSNVATYWTECDEDWITFDVYGTVGDWVNFPAANLGWTVINNDGTPFGVGNTYTEIPELVITYTT